MLVWFGLVSLVCLIFSLSTTIPGYATHMAGYAIHISVCATYIAGWSTHIGHNEIKAKLSQLNQAGTWLILAIVKWLKW